MDNTLADERLQKRGIESGLTGFLNFLPNIEPKDDDRGLPGFLTDSPTEVVKQKHLPRIPLLIGVTGHETANGLDLPSIKGAWGSYDRFLKNLTSSLHLKELVATLTQPLKLPLQLPEVAKYLSTPDNLSPLAILAKLTEISTDVLFNVPATLIADAWSKAAPSFLYQFDYSGKNAVRGSQILAGLPLVSRGQKLESGQPQPAAHGDELAYLFDLRDINGGVLESYGQLSGEEQQVRQRFTKVISDFAAFTGNSTTTSSDLFRSPFSSKGASYIQINQQLRVNPDFRFCTLALWGVPLEASSDKLNCKSLLPLPQTVALPVSLPAVLPKPGVNLANKGGSGSSGFLGIL